MKVAIIGKPNVGKSTLFNRLCGRRLALTHDKPGVTRDFKKFQATIGDLSFELLDTAGMDDSKEAMNQKMQEKTLGAIDDADILLFMVDGRNELTSEDYELVKKIRKFSKPIALLANKCEAGLKIDFDSLLKFGFGNPIEISSEHNLGFEELRSFLVDFKKANPDLGSDFEEESSTNIKISFVGRPNAGKSTIYNKLIGSERVIVSEEAGTTRDAITDFLNYNDRQFEIIDTAGLRRRSKVVESIETLANIETINAVRRSHIVLLILDSTQALEKQDLLILNLIANEGKGILIVFNKSDKIVDKKEFLDEIKYQLENKIKDIVNCEYLVISAINDKNLDRILKKVIKIEESFNRQLATADLNDWLENALSRHTLPLSKKSKRRIKIKFMRQTATRPPTFTLFANIASDIPESYNRYLQKSLSELFSLKSVPIRLKYKKNYNPYVK